MITEKSKIKHRAPRRHLPPTTTIQEGGIYNYDQICESILCGLSRQALRARIKAGLFPAPMKQGSYNYWRGKDILAYTNGEYSNNPKKI